MSINLCNVVLPPAKLKKATSAFFNHVQIHVSIDIGMIKALKGFKGITASFPHS